jgi:integrase
MASIKDRTSESADGTLTLRVVWREGGGRTGSREGETFHDLKAAKRFRDAVNGAGNHWPANYLPRIGWVSPQRYAAALAAAAAAERPEDDGRHHFENYAPRYVELLTGIQPGTRARYLRDIRNHMAEFFKGLDIRDPHQLGTDEVKAWVNLLEHGVRDPRDKDAWLREPLGSGSIGSLHGLLFSIMESAVRRDPPLRGTNPCKGTKLPKRKDGEGSWGMTFLEREEFALLHHHMHPRVQAMVELLAFTGLRIGECTALQVGDLDLDADMPCLHVKRAFKRQDDGSYLLGAPKSAAAVRTVFLGVDQLPALCALAAGRRKDAFLFTMRDGRSPWRHSNIFENYWAPALWKATRCPAHQQEDVERGLVPAKTPIRKHNITPCGCPGTMSPLPRIHDLRHTHVAWLIEAKVQLEVIQVRLGHESITTTIDRYGHLTRGTQAGLVAALDAMGGARLPSLTLVA